MSTLHIAQILVALTVARIQVCKQKTLSAFDADQTDIRLTLLIRIITIVLVIVLIIFALVNCYWCCFC